MKELPRLLTSYEVFHGEEGNQQHKKEFTDYAMRSIKTLADLSGLLAATMAYAEKSGFQANRLDQLVNYIRQSRGSLA